MFKRAVVFTTRGELCLCEDAKATEDIREFQNNPFGGYTNGQVFGFVSKTESNCERVYILIGINHNVQYYLKQREWSCGCVCVLLDLMN